MGDPQNAWLTMGCPQNGWFIIENPIKMDDLGVPPFMETSMCVCMWCRSMDIHAYYMSRVCIYIYICNIERERFVNNPQSLGIYITWYMCSVAFSCCTIPFLIWATTIRQLGGLSALRNALTADRVADATAVTP